MARRLGTDGARPGPLPEPPAVVPLGKPGEAATERDAGTDVGSGGSGAPPGGPSYGGLALAIFVGYMAFAIGLTTWRGVTFIEPDRWAIFLLLGAVVLGRWKAFLRDWVPFVFLLFGFEFLRGIAGEGAIGDGLSAEGHGGIHVEELIDADRALFGGEIPTLWLQDRLYVPGTAHWYDVLSVLVYGLHFVFPLVFAFTLWVRRKDRFWQFTIGLLAVSYLGFAGYLLYPAAPPWLAHQWGYVQGLQDPFPQAFKILAPRRYDNFDTTTLWTLRSPNPVAAMPSLHAAYPWFVLLFAVKVHGRWGLAFLAYNAMVWFAVVYLGHHWVVDILAGVALASVCFAAMHLPWSRLRWSRLRRGLSRPVARPSDG